MEFGIVFLLGLAVFFGLMAVGMLLCLVIYDPKFFFSLIALFGFIYLLGLGAMRLGIG